MVLAGSMPVTELTAVGASVAVVPPLAPAIIPNEAFSEPVVLVLAAAFLPVALPVIIQFLIVILFASNAAATFTVAIRIALP